MKKSKEIIRLYIQSDLSRRQIASALQISRPIVTKTIDKWKESGKSWIELTDMKDSDFHVLLYPKIKPLGKADRLKEFFPQFAKELKKTGVTLQLLWEEYRIDNPDGLKYTQFCYHFQQWK
ncbi:helix-turn-helix domain-containing protein, partial [Oceanispirochaeta sp. M1]|uniref:helix-turn-helix domain-containing protein n=1 Tax=Oceanispirochaeta sp. M1 TaxID=2283433 RepID=UPI001DE162E2|nr:IS21 family transposase [Oceanispirochaeta sp. M1]